MPKVVPFARKLIIAAVTVAGLATAANATIISSPSAIDLGTVGVDIWSSVPFDLTLDNGYTFSGVSGGGVTWPFAVTDVNCSGFGGPGTCSMQEDVFPTAFGPLFTYLYVTECPVLGGACLTTAIQVDGWAGSIATGTPIDFGSVVLGTKVTKSSTITVDGGYQTWGVGGASALTAPFSYDVNACTFSFAGPGSCSMNESFLPTSLGVFTAKLVVSECPLVGGLCILIPVSITGTGVNAPSSVPEPASIALFGIGLVTLARRKWRTPTVKTQQKTAP